MLTMYHLHKLYKDSTISSLDSLRINRMYSSNGCPADSQDIIVISPSKGLKVEHQMMILEEDDIVEDIMKNLSHLECISDQ